MGELILLTLISIVLLIVAVGIEVLPILVVAWMIYKILKLLIERD